MAFLVEGISLVIKRSSITQIYPGGWEGFLAIVPNEKLCFDEDLVRASQPHVPASLS